MGRDNHSNIVPVTRDHIVGWHPIISAVGCDAVCFRYCRGSVGKLCADLGHLKMDGVEITKAAMIPAGTTIPPAYPGAPAIGPLPAHCRVDGVINRRKGADGEEFGIGFALAMPDATAWNGDFMMQGGSDGNGVVSYPLGASYAGDKPALVRGFAVASTDTGQKAKAGPFDFSFMRDQQAYLDFAYQANADGGAEKVSEWSEMFLVPGMRHFGGGPALDQFDMLGAVVNWVEKGTVPESVIATGQAFPGRSRPLGAYPKHAQYLGHGDTNDAHNFKCQ